MKSEKFHAHLAEMPLIAILRGLHPSEAIGVVEELMMQGIRVVEVPLNSPEPFTSIEKIAGHFGARVTVGAGTVLSEQDADRVSAAGGEIAVSPGVNAGVIRRVLELGMEPIPGIATPTEALTAMEAGATLLKVFPAASLGADFFRHLLAVLPAPGRLLAVGGVDLSNTRQFLAAGAVGVGLGSSLFRPGAHRHTLARHALRFTEVVQETERA